MNRRLFLGLLGAAALADPERLLWVPGKKKIFIPGPTESWIKSWPALIRIPLMRRPGGPFGRYNPCGIGRGEGMVITAAIACEFPRRDVAVQDLRPMPAQSLLDPIAAWRGHGKRYFSSSRFEEDFGS